MTPLGATHYQNFTFNRFARLLAAATALSACTEVTRANSRVAAPAMAAASPTLRGARTIPAPHFGRKSSCIMSHRVSIRVHWPHTGTSLARPALQQHHVRQGIFATHRGGTAGGEVALAEACELQSTEVQLPCYRPAALVVHRVRHPRQRQRRSSQRWACWALSPCWGMWICAAS